MAVNTDASVRQYKGANRPIVGEQHRAALVAALEPVDYVFLFSERRNARNIEEIRPDFYIKAGDYSRSGLTSGELVEQYGGEVVLLDIQNDISTSTLIQKTLEHSTDQAAPSNRVGQASSPAIGSQTPPQVGRASSPAQASPTSSPAISLSQSAAPHEQPPQEPQSVCIDTRPLKTSPAVFLDRDGTINEEVEYLHEPEKFRLLPGAAEGMRRFADMGYRIVIITTQAGIGLGYFTKEDFFRTNQAMFRALAPFGAAVDRIYFCPHGKREDCSCRKPKTALFERAAADLNIDLTRSICIGDKTSDIEAGRRLGLTAILVTTGHAGRDGEYDTPPHHTSPTILAAAQWILQQERTAPRA